MLIYVRVFLHYLSYMMDIPLFRTGAPRGPMSVSLEKQIKDRHGYVAVFLYMICQGASFF